jgi:hypothetical protein
VITLTHGGYIKRIPLDTYRRQNRGGKGVKGMPTKEKDFVEKPAHHDDAPYDPVLHEPRPRLSSEGLRDRRGEPHREGHGDC